MTKAHSDKTALNKKYNQNHHEKSVLISQSTVYFTFGYYISVGSLSPGFVFQHMPFIAYMLFVHIVMGIIHVCATIMYGVINESVNRRW